MVLHCSGQPKNSVPHSVEVTIPNAASLSPLSLTQPEKVVRKRKRSSAIEHSVYVWRGPEMFYIGSTTAASAKLNQTEPRLCPAIRERQGASPMALTLNVATLARAWNPPSGDGGYTGRWYVISTPLPKNHGLATVATNRQT